jgi:predicted nucleic acid-binding Zn ribbon protein
VWRVPLRVAGEWTARAQTWLVPVCAGCRPWTRDTLRPEPCQGCGRGVVAAAHEYWPWAGQVFCSDYCAAQWWDAQRVTGVAHVHPGARPEAERHVDAGCVVCGRAVASHHVTCSGACRQRLYRSRKRGLLAILGATRR